MNVPPWAWLGMAAIVGFMVVHVALALLVPRTILAMLTGGPAVPAQDKHPEGAPAPTTPH